MQHSTAYPSFSAEPYYPLFPVQPQPQSLVFVSQPSQQDLTECHLRIDDLHQRIQDQNQKAMDQWNKQGDVFVDHKREFYDSIEKLKREHHSSVIELDSKINQVKTELSQLNPKVNRILGRIQSLEQRQLSLEQGLENLKTKFELVYEQYDIRFTSLEKAMVEQFNSLVHHTCLQTQKNELQEKQNCELQGQMHTLREQLLRLNTAILEDMLKQTVNTQPTSALHSYPVPSQPVPIQPPHPISVPAVRILQPVSFRSTPALPLPPPPSTGPLHSNRLSRNQGLGHS